MDDEKVFGKYIDIKTVTWAIENNKITDYNLLILKNNESEINNIISNLKNNIIIENKELFLAAYMTLKSIIQYSKLKHVLIYTNTTNSADLVENYIEIIIQSKIIDIGNNYYNKSLHSGNTNNINSEIKKFINSPIGIISSVYIFGEGFDCPSLYGVVFAENMDSDIRIVQCALRPNRLEKPNKKAYIIIPYIDTDNFITDNNSFDKCRKIIAKIRNVDEHIECKIKVKTINNNKIIKNNETNIQLIDTTNDYIDNPNELNKIILRLRYSKALYSNFSEEQDEFNYIKQLNKELNIKSKIEYSNINLNHPNYIINPEEYFRTKGVWTNWYDFLGYNTINFIQSKNEWIEFCKNNNVKTLNDYDNLCNQYEKLPRNPSDFYKNFTNIIKELNLDKLRR
jgi:predicted helicase